MTPPINIDGSQVSEVTIDGQPVSQVTIDGQDVLSAIPDSGVARWDFEDDSDTTEAVDVWGDSNGSISGPSYSSSTVAEGSFALDFDESNDDEVVVPSDVYSFDGSSFTISAYIQFKDTGDDVVFSKGPESDNDNEQLVIGAYGGGIEFSFYADDLRGPTPATDTWVRWTFTYDSGTGDRVIWNGDTEDVSDTANDDLKNTDSSDLKFGDDLDSIISGAQQPNIYLDDTRIYDKALSSTEVSNLVDTGSIDG
jgi:hypothetical protein